MTETIHIGEISIRVTKKDVKHAHLSVHPPVGRVTLVVPRTTRMDVARAYAVSRLGWIRNHQSKLLEQARETPRHYIERESHYLWGRRYLLEVKEHGEKPTVRLNHRKITLAIRPGSSRVKRGELMQEWHRMLLHEVVPELIRKWERKLGVTVHGYFLQRMKTKWGACNHRVGNIRINTELAKKPKDLLEYVVVHEMTHLLEPKHSERFVALLDKHYPAWRESRAELNELPLSSEIWKVARPASR